MSSSDLTDSLTRRVKAVFARSWKTLVLTDLAFKIVAFVVLTPLVGITFRAWLAVSGETVVSDFDIARFFLGPAGWLAAILAGSIWLAICAIELASLMAIVAARTVDQHVSVVDALRFSASHIWPIIQVTLRIVAWTLAIAAPFIGVAAGVYLSLLTEFDINFYLKEKPPVFLASVGIGLVLAVLLAAILLRLYAGWLFALPLVLFESVRPSEALAVSGQRTRSHRRRILLAILGWGLLVFGMSAAVTGIIGVIGRAVVPGATGSLEWLAVTIGAMMLLWAVLNLAVNLLGSITFALLLWELYLSLRDSGAPRPRFETADTAAAVTGFPITKRRLIVAGIIGVLAAIGIGVFTLRSVPLQDDVEIMAHRGSSKSAPENTLAAISQAIEDGADWVEIDVQETADGEVVVLHDSDFMKLAGSDLKIWNATMDDLRDIDIGSWFDPAFEEQRVPTLAEVLALCKGKIRVNIELKYYGHDQQLEQRVSDIVGTLDMDSQVMAMSLKIDGVRKMKAIRPEWKVGLLMSVAAGDLSQVDADFLAVNAGFVNRRFVQDAHRNDRQVFVWTVNDAPTMSAMISRGVDGLLTDRPAVAREVLRQRADMSGPERLLLELAGMFGLSPRLAEQ